MASLRTISDDGVRVWIDDALVIDNWKPHESEVDYAPVSGGRHAIRVNDQYRIVFRFEGEHAFDVCCRDYH